MDQDHLEEFLLDSSWVDEDPARLDRLRHRLRSPGFELSRVRAAAVVQRTLPLVAHALDGLGAVEGTPLETAPEYRELLDAAGVQSASIARQLAELSRLLAGCRRAGLAPIVLKGPAWEVSLYRNLHVRHFRDLDLLLPTELFAELDVVLRESGYVQGTFDRDSRTITPLPREHIESALTSGRHAVPYIRHDDEHGQLFVVEPHGTRNDENFHKIDTSVLLDRTVEFGDGRELMPVASLIYAAAYFHKALYVYSPVGESAMPRLRWFCDIRQMFLRWPRLDTWLDLYEQAAVVRAVDKVYFALVHTDRLFPGVVPRKLLVPPETLGDDPVTVIDDVWRFTGCSSTLRQRMLQPQLDATRYLALRAEGTAGGRLDVPHVDHLPDGWPDTEPVKLSGVAPAPPWQYFGTHVSYGRIPASDEDLSARFALCWSGTELCFTAEVTDDVLVFDQHSGNYQGQDCVQLLFEVPLGSGNLINLFLVPRAADLDGPALLRKYSAVGFQAAGTIPVPGASATADIGPTGYLVRTRVPLSALGLSPDDREYFGFDVAVYDCDRPGEERKTVLQWSGGRNSMRNTSFFGLARLAGEGR